MRKQLIYAAVGAFLTFVVTINWAEHTYSHPNVWPIDRNGLNDINKSMAEDKSRRIAILVMTEKAIYSTQDLEMYDKGGHKGYRIVGGIVNVDGKMVYGNF